MPSYYQEKGVLIVSGFDLRKIDATIFNRWQMERHYLKRPVIKTKMLAHGVFVDGDLVGGLLWVTPHFTKKRNLFGYDGLLDKWEVLVLGRFYLVDGSGLVASSVMAESIGRGRNRGSHNRGWRLQQDWVKENPPIDPKTPFVPRLLMSWSDEVYGHEGTIYKASGWEYFDTTDSSGRRNNNDGISNKGKKKLWILRLKRNKRAEKIGGKLWRQATSQMDLLKTIR